MRADRTAPTIALTLGLLAGLAGPGWSQDDPNAAIMKRGRAAPAEALLAFRFPGGNVAEYVATVRRVYADQTGGKKFNLIVTGTPEHVTLPAFELTDTTIHDALEALKYIARDKNNRVQVSRQQPRSRGGQTIWILEAVGKPPAAKTRRSSYRASTAVFSIRQLTTALPGIPAEHCYPLTAVLGAVEAGLEIGHDADSQDAPSVVVKHHAASGLLFVRGSQQEISMISSVLSSLETDLNRRRQAQQQNRKGGPSRASTPGPAGPSSSGPARGGRSGPAPTPDSKNKTRKGTS